MASFQTLCPGACCAGIGAKDCVSKDKRADGAGGQRLRLFFISSLGFSNRVRALFDEAALKQALAFHEAEDDTQRPANFGVENAAQSVKVVIAWAVGRNADRVIERKNPIVVVEHAVGEGLVDFGAVGVEGLRAQRNDVKNENIEREDACPGAEVPKDTGLACSE